MLKKLILGTAVAIGAVLAHHGAVQAAEPKGRIVGVTFHHPGRLLVFEFS